MDKKNIDALKKKLVNGEAFSDADRNVLQELIDHDYQKNELTEKSKLLEAVAKISTTLLQTSDFEQSLNNIFQIISKAILVDRIYYFENSFDESGELVTSQKVEWTRGKTPPQIENPKLQNISNDFLAEFLIPLSKGEPYKAIIKDLKPGNVKNLFKSQDILSILVLPIFVQEKFYGFIGFDDCTTSRNWSQEEISVLQTLCSQLAITIEKSQVEELLEKTYRLAGIGTWEMNLETGEYSWSAITKEILEVEPDIEPDSDLADSFFKDADSKKMIMDDINHSIEQGKPYSREIEIQTAKGNSKWVRDTGQAEFENGTCVRIYGTLQDIDDRKKAEIESKKNKKLLDSITEQTEMAIWVRKSDGTHLFVNKEWKRIFGFQDQVVVGKSIYDLLDKETADNVMSYDIQVLESQKQELYEERVQTTSGDRYFMVNKFPLTGIKGLEDAVGGIGTDITKIKETEQKLQEAEQKIREIIEHSTNLFYKHSPDFKLTYLSPQAKGFLGCKPENAKLYWGEFLTDHPENVKGLKLKKEAIKTGNPKPPYELQIKKKDGKVIWVEVNEAPIVRDGTTVAMVGSLTNITDRKKVQDEIKNSLKEKETLLIEIHHRVKNNLAVVASLLQFQAYGTANDDLFSKLSESVLRIKSIAAIHEQLYQSKDFSELDFAKNVKLLTKNIINTMQLNTAIVVDFDLEQVSLNVSQAISCSLILNEIITNVVKHAFPDRSQGSVKISLSRQEKRIFVSVSDNGVGFPDEFDIEKSSSVGMKLVQTLTQQLGADIKFESGDTGSVFLMNFLKE